MELFAGSAAQYGIFAGTYGLACVLFSQPHLQVVVVGNGQTAEELNQVALREFVLNKSIIRLSTNEAVAQNLPPALAETIPNLPAVQQRQTVAVMCSNFTCQPPIASAKELSQALSRRE
jgi:uncharacterized protein YyaL (SSP411 family)